MAKTNSKTIKNVLNALGGESAELSAKRVEHILSNNKSYGKTVEKMAEEVFDHVNNSKLVKINGPLREFGKTYSEDVTQFAKNNLKSIDSDVKKVIEEGISVNGSKKPFKIKYDDISESNIKGSQNYINLRNDYNKKIADEAKAAEDIVNLNKKLQGMKLDVDNIVSTRELKKNRYDDKVNYMQWNQGKKYDEAIDAFKKEDFNNPLLKQLKDKGVDIKKLNVDNLQALRQEAINNVSAKDMKMMDLIEYYKAPQIATGILGTAWLVNKMAASSGTQTNSQLYGQSQY